MYRLISLSLALAVFSLPANADESKGGWCLTDINGKTHRPFENQQTRGIVLIFISTDCPIANAYQPMLRRMANSFEKQGIRFFMLHPHKRTTVAKAQKHQAEYKIESHVCLDAKHAIAERVGATVTPEAFVFISNQKKPVYQGRIDNRYADFGKKRSKATSRELADALEAVVAGRRPAITKTKAVGCFIK